MVCATFSTSMFAPKNKNSQLYFSCCCRGRLLKLDILGHDDPTMLRMLKDITGLDPQEIPLDDEKVISLFTGTSALDLKEDDFDIPLGTCGIPEFGTNFVRQMVLDTKPTAFSDLIRISAGGSILKLPPSLLNHSSFHHISLFFSIFIKSSLKTITF